MEHIYNYEAFTGKNVQTQELSDAGKLSNEEQIEDETVTPEEVLSEVDEQEISEIPSDNTDEKHIFNFNEFAPTN